MQTVLNQLRFLIIFSVISGFSIAQDDFSDDAVDGETVNLTGNVIDSKTGDAIAGANIVVEGTDLGAASDESGAYSIEDVTIGSSVTVTVVGYENVTKFADSSSLNFELTSKVIEMLELEVLASRADENTAVAYSNVSKEDLNLRLGSRDIPLALNTVPSVYATNQGGGAGDARINVRGFNQRNVAIMINGVPVNDMENGWVYWSNWDGLADATSSIQMQKGLSAVNLATPSIGGSMNIITDPTSQNKRGLFKQEIGAFGFLKSTLSYHSGLIMDGKLALSGTVVRKVGEGYRAGTWTDAWAYYFGASYNLNPSHRFEFYALGAPQRHGQSLYRQNIATYDTDFAKSLDDYNQDALVENGGKFSDAGIDFNQNVSDISDASQTILDNGSGQHWQMYSIRDGVDRHESGNLSERENFFHKPQVAINHYWTINNTTRLSSSLYWSGGMGGGTGTYGSIDRSPAVEGNNWWASSPWTWNWDKTIAYNDTSSSGSKGVLRNSNNRQSTIGVLSKINYDVNDNLKTQFGIDARSARIYHVKTIRDLLGGDYFINTDSDFDADNQQKGLGDPVDYNYTNTVGWLGFFGQAKYSSGPLTAYGMAGLTSVKYTHWNHFMRASDYNFSYVEEKDGSDASWVEAPGDDMGGNPGELYIEADPISTSQVKGGVLYDLGDALSFFEAIPYFGKLSNNTSAWFNFGLVDKAPIFDQVITDDTAQLSTNPTNEKFTAFEFGVNGNSNDGLMAIKTNFYYTLWSDRIATRTIQNLDGDDDIIFLTGIDQLHTGVEAELAMQVHPLVRVDLGVGLGNWRYVDDAKGRYKNYDGEEEEIEYTYYLKDLNVGDMPQTTLSVGFTVNPIDRATINFNYRYYSRNVSDWSPTSRTDENDTRSTWVAPSYGVLDIHGSYDIPYDVAGASPTFYLHIFNALDEVYIQDATDNSRYNAWGSNHYASDAEVFFGLPFRFNTGLSINF